LRQAHGVVITKHRIRPFFASPQAMKQPRLATAYAERLFMSAWRHWPFDVTGATHEEGAGRGRSQVGRHPALHLGRRHLVLRRDELLPRDEGSARASPNDVSRRCLDSDTCLRSLLEEFHHPLRDSFCEAPGCSWTLTPAIEKTLFDVSIPIRTICSASVSLDRNFTERIPASMPLGAVHLDSGARSQADPQHSPEIAGLTQARDVPRGQWLSGSFNRLRLQEPLCAVEAPVAITLDFSIKLIFLRIFFLL
jgi:hypothetical protein